MKFLPPSASVSILQSTWHSEVVSTLASINVVNQHWARLVQGWVTVLSAGG